MSVNLYYYMLEGYKKETLTLFLRWGPGVERKSAVCVRMLVSAGSHSGPASSQKLECHYTNTQIRRKSSFNPLLMT